MMEQGLGSESIPTSATLDKSRIFNVKPLRCLEPMFPSSSSGTSSFSSPQSASFVCTPPTGPFPPGVTSFFPFISHNGSVSQDWPHSVNGNGYMMNKCNQNMGSSKGESTRKKMRNSEDGDGDGDDIDADIEMVANSFLSSYDLMRFDSSSQAEGDKESVNFVLMMFDLLRRKIIQHEDSKGGTSSIIARNANLKAGAFLLNRGIRTNTQKKIGAVSGIEVGDIFFFRMELCVVGMHAPPMAGIDYMSMKIVSDEESVAVGIVSSGGYEDNDDDDDNGEILIYSGQGGNMNRKDKDVTISDQKLIKGNLALEKSLHKGNDIRVIRGMKDLAHPTGKVYFYDGLYRVQESWVEKGKAGYNNFKYKLGRVPGQPQAFTLWKSIQRWKESISSRNGVILTDLTFGAENLPVCVVNEVDNEKNPASFTYSTSLKNVKPINSCKSCSCRGGCQPGNLNCCCVHKNEGSLSYSSLGVALSSNSLIYECGSSCLCPLNCRNRISQAGLKVQLEVFKTKNKGWGVRSWDPIRAGAFICEYAGEIVEKSNDDDDYVFDMSRTYKSNGYVKVPYPVVISSRKIGNVGRFMNHSCDPNVYWLPISRGNNDNESDIHIGLFAIRNIAPMNELSFDYGIPFESGKEKKRKKCLCGSLHSCRGYYF
ncbi:histone-lysine N-methyltransferase, H3 lysine-9 specific SUVH1-like [Impatiens glandulifera]|uniref:histone-lysine N-methyltransferase, H3 lysine-9 specific SUVH1-like n=1 Tax=Impatiens glandulifera TaxID=253017 RepID=UPI001FB0C66D|nr:histone-lysine N-methyltransferase, H3 lysine-9 specific SUVH1-like [Impatiens glandulifera]